MARIVAKLQKDHQNVTVLLRLLDPAMEDSRPATPADFHPLVDILNYLTRYSDLFHHPVEELLFRRLAARREAIAPVVAELGAQHRALGEMGGELLQRVRDIVNGFEMLHGGFEHERREYASRLREHMRVEEAEVFPLASRILGEDDWGAIERGVVPRADPLFNAGREAEYAALHAHIVARGG